MLWLALREIGKSHVLETLRVLHFAPETCLRSRFQRMFLDYQTADLDATGVDHQVDLCNLPFPDGSFDLIMACHVMEHIREDHEALKNIKRVLSENGLAILPVPIIAEHTIEYSEPNPLEHYHVRAPGFDFYERYWNIFPKVQIFSSRDFDQRFQLWTYEDRTRFPTPAMPLRPAMTGERHEDFLPVCHMR